MKLVLLLSALLAVAIKISGCQGQPSNFSLLMKGENVIKRLPTILNRSDIESIFPDTYDSMDDDERHREIEATDSGKQLRVIGKYTQIDVRQRKEPPPVYRGHVAIILADRTAVFLRPMWHPSARRPAEEIARYENKQVVVVGKMVPRTPEPPEVQAMIVAPCMVTIDSIDFWTQK